MADETKKSGAHDDRAEQLHQVRSDRPTIGLLGLLGMFWNQSAQITRQHGINQIGFACGELGSPYGFVAQANVLADLAGAGNVDGLIVWSDYIGHYIEPAALRALCERYRPLPVVSIGAVEGVPSIVVDNYRGTYDMVVHLIETHGYRRIACIRGPENNPEAEQRYQAYLDVLSARGIPFDETLVVTGAFGESCAWEAVHLLLDQRGAEFEALVAPTDEVAMRVIQLLHGRGIYVPADVAVVGFDDEGADYAPPLTSVHAQWLEAIVRAVETMEKLLQGEPVPQRVTLTSRLVVRQSCGCLAPAVIEAAASPVSTTDTPLATALTEQRDHVLAEMVRVPGCAQCLDVEQCVQLLDAFAAQMAGEQTTLFFSTLARYLQQAEKVAPWQGAISALRHCLLPYLLHDTTVLARAEDLWHQARVMVAHAAEQERTKRFVQAQRQADKLRQLGRSLVNVVDMEGLTTILAQALPSWKIPTCYLVLYENPTDPMGMARLAWAYEHGEDSLHQDGPRFPAHQLIPGERFPRDRWYAFRLEALYFRNEQLGFILFEPGPPDMIIYDTLREHISSALKRVLLIQEHRRAEERLVAVHTLGEKLVLSRSVPEIADLVLDAAQQVLRMPVSTLWLVNDKHTPPLLEMHVSRLSRYSMMPIPLDCEKSIIALAARAARPIYVPDITQEPRYLGGAISSRCELCVPLQVGERVLGVLNIETTQVDGLNPSDRQLAESLANAAAIAFHNAHLYGETRRRAERLVTANQAVKAVNKELQAFAYSVSHDLRAPLRHIQGFAQLLLKREAERLDATSVHYLNAIDQASTNMSELIGALLTFSRTGRAEMHLQRVAISDLAASVMDELVAEHPTRRISYQIAPLPEVEGDPALLRQVWVNLISNAIKYTAPRQVALVEIGVTSRNASHVPGYVTFFVRDNGVGFNPDYAHRLFDVFQRLHRDDEFEGTGIGLAIVQRIVRRHGGQVWAEAELGKGAVFYFTLKEAKGEQYE